MELDFNNPIIFWAVRIVAAAAILLIGLWLSYAISNFVRRKAIENPRIDTTLGTFFALVVRYGIMIIVLIAVVQQFGVQTASLVAVLGASALAVGLALQGTLTNVASGIMIALIRPYNIGDYVELNDKQGKVTDLDMFFTNLLTPDDRNILIPNGQAVSNPIINFSREGLRCCEIELGVSYQDDLDQAMEVMRQVALDDPRTLADPVPSVAVMDLGEYAVKLRGRFWVPTDDWEDYRSAILKAVKEAFDREGIEIPYPHAVEISRGELPLRGAPVKPRRTKV